jgi:hypothetical protein
MYFENAIRNFEFHGDPDAAGVFGRFANVPLIIVSAGPSLDRNIHHLRGIEDRCFILAVDTSLRPLKAAGITPHAAIIADPSPMNARHVVGALSPSTFLFAEQAADASALNEASRRFLFALGLFPDSLFRKFGVARSPLDVWGSVATAALDLAIRMKANPIIFAGQDFAYSWGRDYASHTIFHDVPFSVEYSGRIQMQDIFGKPIRTTENLVAYRDFFTRKMAAHPHTRFINATEGGILKDGVELLSLQEAVSQACTKTVNVAGALARHHQTKRVTPDALKHLLRVLQSKSEDCDCLREFLDLVAKESVLKDDAAAFGEKIQWAVDLLQRHPVLAGATR